MAARTLWRLNYLWCFASLISLIALLTPFSHWRELEALILPLGFWSPYSFLLIGGWQIRSDTKGQIGLLFCTMLLVGTNLVALLACSGGRTEAERVGNQIIPLFLLIFQVPVGLGGLFWAVHRYRPETQP